MQNIPNTINPFKFASQSLTFTQTYQVKDFPRVKDTTNNQESAVYVRLDFALKDNLIPYVVGKINLDLELSCQRCLDNVSISLEPNFKIAFLQANQQTKILDKSFDIVVNDKTEFSTIEFITDEILISIPMTLKHDYQCTLYNVAQVKNQHKQNNSFAILTKQ